MRVLSVASEAYPIIKTGGLADVAGALPAALAPHGATLTTLLPGYPSVVQSLGAGEVIHTYKSLLGVKARLVRHSDAVIDLIVLDAPALFAREGGPYSDPTGSEWPDNWQRFAALGRAAADLAGGLVPSLDFDLVHAHDWQAATAPVYLRHGNAKAQKTPSILTIHNLAFQGRYGPEIFKGLDLPQAAFHIDGIEYYGGVGFLKGGLQCATAITTVSPSYAQEIRLAEFGMGLEGMINARAASVRGIVNGIDTQVWNPATDRHLNSHYSAGKLGDRAGNRAALKSLFGLTASRGPLFCVVSRLTWQKGIDILVDLFDDIVAMGGQLAILGAGDAALEAATVAASGRHSGHIGVRIGYDEALSHLLQGGSDAIIVPSRFEPCGLTQLYGLRYGCIPVVARTGGLADTVIDANEAALCAGVATGFQFDEVTHDSLRHALRRAVTTFNQRKDWKSLQKNAMKADFSWARSGLRYAQLYKELL
ncbi:glycogen synthase GlgA [Asticcacaulis sp. AC402]|uniref:glycogen synthase GlgA n=1 Tax=Asticcacaulis sp. AC402 TaxID=1282361 RepID=UPI0003C3BD0C|nr:glycogen synthase GlgA [Asticcacaulis sp. AC402]ESQ73793.1 hypothetical protein ABAC402_17255 [Asticcacaulis sp. AC402]